MTNSENERIRIKFVELKFKIRYCSYIFCSSTDRLEFAHLEKTTLEGSGRGRKERYYDIINNPDKYGYLCNRHHKAFDNGQIKRKDINSVEVYI